MILYIIIAVLCLGLAIYLFLWYNSGMGGSIKSKRPLYAASLGMFIVFVFFSIKAYYYNDNKNRKQIILELSKEFNEFEKIQLNKDLNQKNQIQKIQNGLNKIRIQLYKIEKVLQDSNLLINKVKIQTKQIDSLLSNRVDSVSLTIGDFDSKFHVLLSSLESEKSKEYDTWFTIFISIICGFLIFVLGFTFKKKILG
jgi:septal ring factor EnvC (AmiA/AmiB activator)